jgi:hypothetical protein
MMRVVNIMNIDIGIQAILRIHLRDLRGFNVDITDERIFDVRRSDGFMSPDKHTNYHEDSYGRPSRIKVWPQKFERL